MPIGSDRLPVGEFFRQTFGMGEVAGRVDKRDVTEDLQKISHLTRAGLFGKQSDVGLQELDPIGLEE
jgi:hypothetical protein